MASFKVDGDAEVVWLFQDDNEDNIDFEDLTRRFEALKKKKWLNSCQDEKANIDFAILNFTPCR